MVYKLSAKTNGQNNSYQIRIFLLLTGVVGCLALIMFRMFNLQVVNHAHYSAIAAGQHGSDQVLQPTRGEIYFNGNGQDPVLAATNITLSTVFAVPREVTDDTATAAKLYEILGMTIEEVKDKIKGDGGYSAIKKQVTDEQVKQIKELGLVGIYQEPETVRYYPGNNLAAHILGFLGFRGTERVGQYGIEGNFNSALAGSAGIMGIETDSAGRWITFASRNLAPAEDGQDIYLTIDAAVQYKAQEVLKKTVAEHGATGGSVIIMNPKTGAVMAMANNPDFDPNTYNMVPDLSHYVNTALSLDYEPGSIFKPITMAAAINERKVTPDTVYEDLGFVEMDEFKIRNSDGEAHGMQTMTQVLEKSLNTGMIFVEQQLGHSKFRDYVHRFGFGKKTGIELPNEILGNLDNLEKKSDIFFATSSYGQGHTVTPLQITTAYTALANAGKLMKPYIVQKVVHSNGREEITEPEKVEQVIEPSTAAQVTAMMVNVVENGHGKRAAVPGYYIAGKTGTAQVPYKDRAGYEPGKTIGSFVGYGPVDNPQFVMLVRIDNPQGVRFAESTAAPAFGEIASFILNYLQVPPSR
jgi:cell division protein FtsI/penicillin-binding protein 2